MSYRYLGNKSRLADWIGGIVQDRLPKGSAIADPMCGTATMSETFAAAGYAVVASDELRFPVLHAQARLLHNGRHSFAPVAGSYEEALSILNALPPDRGFFWREYSDAGRPANGCRPRAYFTGANAARIDAVRDTLRQWRDEGLAPLSADLLLHDLILAVNRVANIAGTYGYFRSKWNASSLQPLQLTPTPAASFDQPHRVLHGKAQDLVGSLATSAVYLDPPYTKRQYGGNYHILETIAREDEPFAFGEGGLRDWRPQASDFCYGRRAPAAFKTILDKITARWVFVSYSEDGHVPTTELTALLREYGTVELHTRPIDRFRSNARVARSGDVREHLYSLEMNHAGAAERRGNMDKEAEPQRALCD